MEERDGRALVTVSVQSGMIDGESDVTIFVILFTLNGTASHEDNGTCKIIVRARL